MIMLTLLLSYSHISHVSNVVHLQNNTEMSCTFSYSWLTVSVLWSIITVEYSSSQDSITELLPPANEVSEGYDFTGVCLSTGGVSSPLHAGIHPPGPEADTPPRNTALGSHPPPPRSACWDMVNKWAVHIPLECILVSVLDDVATCFIIDQNINYFGRSPFYDQIVFTY